MKKIAILRCMKVSNSCTGSGCLKTWNGRDRAFAGYAEEDQLISFFHCNGCDCDPATNEGMQKKLNRLQKNGITVVHTGDCTVRDKESGLRCPKINEIVQLLQERGIETVHGTHHK